MNTGRKHIRWILKQEAKKGKIQRTIVKEYFKILRAKEITRLEQQRADNIRKTAVNLTEHDKFSAEGYWKLKKSMSTGRNQSKVTSLLIDGNIQVTGYWFPRW